MFKGSIIIPYMDVLTIFCTRNNTKNVWYFIRFYGRQKQRKRAQWNYIEDAFSPSTAICWLICDETIYYQNKSLCLILSVDGCFIYFCIKTLCKGIFIFSCGLQNWPSTVTWLLLRLLVQMKVLYISNILWKFHSNRLNGSGDTLCSAHKPSIFMSPWNMLGTEVLVFEVLDSESVKQFRKFSPTIYPLIIIYRL